MHENHPKNTAFVRTHPTLEHREAILLYLAHFQDQIKAKIYPYFIVREELLATEDPMFHDEIRRQFYDTCRLVLAIEVAQNLGFDAATIVETLEDVDNRALYEYLGHRGDR